MFDAKGLAKALSSYDPEDLSGSLSQYAAVAVIVRIDSTGHAWIGYIRRAHHINDKWAGHVAFPGGKHDPEDKTSLDTAVRETLEEVGIRLTQESHLGRLPDIQARNQGGLLQFYIRPHVFVIYEDPVLTLDSSEVASFEWVSVAWFFEPQNRATYPLTTASGTIQLPAFAMPDQSILWGLTYMMTGEFLELITRHKLIDIRGA